MGKMGRGSARARRVLIICLTLMLGDGVFPIWSAVVEAAFSTPVGDPPVSGAPRVIAITDRETMAGGTVDPRRFSLERTLSQVARQAAKLGHPTTPEELFRSLWNVAGPHGVGSGMRVGQEDVWHAAEAEGRGSVAEIRDRMVEYETVSLEGRIHLAGDRCACGAFRVEYGRGNSRVVFQAVIPNPQPGQLDGCAPIIQFWEALSPMTDPDHRARELERFFYAGLPGFHPAIHLEHLGGTNRDSACAGAIHTAQFLLGPWVKKDLRVSIACEGSPCPLELTPTSVRVEAP